MPGRRSSDPMACSGPGRPGPGGYASGTASSSGTTPGHRHFSTGCPWSCGCRGRNAREAKLRDRVVSVAPAATARRCQAPHPGRRESAGAARVSGGGSAPSAGPGDGGSSPRGRRPRPEASGGPGVPPGPSTSTHPRGRWRPSGLHPNECASGGGGGGLRGQAAAAGGVPDATPDPHPPRSPSPRLPARGRRPECAARSRSGERRIGGIDRGGHAGG